MSVTWWLTQLHKFPVIEETRGPLGFIKYRKWTIFESPIISIYVEFTTLRNQTQRKSNPSHELRYTVWGRYIERIESKDGQFKDFSRVKGSISLIRAGTDSLIVALIPSYILIVRGPMIKT
jgi:hypothetical protein